MGIGWGPCDGSGLRATIIVYGHSATMRVLVAIVCRNLVMLAATVSPSDPGVKGMHVLLRLYW